MRRPGRPDPPMGARSPAVAGRRRPRYRAVRRACRVHPRYGLWIAATPVAGRPGVVRVIVRGLLDLLTADHLRARLRAALPPGDLELVELDLSRVTFCDLAGLRALLGARDDAIRAGHRLALVAADPYTELMITTLGLAGEFDYRRPDRG
jgi:anti-anti-sigma factor